METGTPHVTVTQMKMMMMAWTRVLDVERVRQGWFENVVWR